MRGNAEEYRYRTIVKIGEDGLLERLTGKRRVKREILLVDEIGSNCTGGDVAGAARILHTADRQRVSSGGAIDRVGERGLEEVADIGAVGQREGLGGALASDELDRRRIGPGGG